MQIRNPNRNSNSPSEKLIYQYFSISLKITVGKSIVAIIVSITVIASKPLIVILHVRQMTMK